MDRYHPLPLNFIIMPIWFHIIFWLGALEVLFLVVRLLIGAFVPKTMKALTPGASPIKVFFMRIENAAFAGFLMWLMYIAFIVSY